MLWDDNFFYIVYEVLLEFIGLLWFVLGKFLILRVKIDIIFFIECFICLVLLV